MWDNGIPDDPATLDINEHQVLIAVGDTFGGPNSADWRPNTILRSSDTDLSNGITIPDGQWFTGNWFGGAPLGPDGYPNRARQVILPSGLPAGVTLIPTAGISIPTPGTEFGVTQYMSFMSVTQWGAPGQWSTNYSALAYSTDNGENWTVAPQTVRYNQPWSGNQNFQQSAFVRPGDGYVYVYGTPNGRQGAAYLSRVAEKDILDLSKYDYYSAGSPGWFGWGATPAGWYKNDPSAGYRGLRAGHRRLRRRQPRQPGQRDVGAVQQAAEQVRGALRRPVQQRRDAHVGHAAGDVVVRKGVDGPAERRNLRTDDASVVAVDRGYRHRPVLEPVAVV